MALPDPVPDPPDSVIHRAFDEIVQAHVDVVVTVIVPVPPPGVAVTSKGLTEKEHDGLGSVTTKLTPAIVSVAVRDPDVVLDAAVNPTLPEPVRFVPFEIVTHEAPLVALHVHPAPVVTATVPVPPAAPIAWLRAESV